MTEQEYMEHMDALMRAKCGHALMPSLFRGYSKANVMYLKAVLKSLTPTPSPAKKGDDPPAPGITIDEFSLKVLYVRKSRLFGERNSLSNKMCDLPEGKEYDKKRARYSDDIQSVQRDIEAVMREIVAAESGEMRQNSEKPEMPTNEADLLRKLNSLRASRSRQRGIEKTAKGKNLEKCRDELKRLEKLISDVETALSENFR
jgi:hypothetical protein